MPGHGRHFCFDSHFPAAFHQAGHFDKFKMQFNSQLGLNFAGSRPFRRGIRNLSSRKQTCKEDAGFCWNECLACIKVLLH